MSTKIYGGFRLALPGKVDFLTVQAALGQISERLIEVARTESIRNVLQMAASELDQACMRKAGLLDVLSEDKMRAPNGNYIDDAIQALLERAAELERSGRRDPSIDMSCEVVLLPHDTGLYGIAYTENRKIDHCFFAFSGVERFAYWDNTDPPDEVTESDWAKRGRIWRELLPGAGIPAECGFSRKLSPVFVMPDLDSVIDAWSKDPSLAPSLDARLKSYVSDSVANALILALPPSERAHGPAVMRAVRRAISPNEPEIADLRKAHERRIRAVLVEALSPESFLVQEHGKPRKMN